MRLRITNILIGFFLSLFLCVSSFAQNKIVVVDTKVFEDEKSGITELVNANAKVIAEFKPLNEKLYPYIEKHKSLQKQIEIELPICKVECFSLEKKIDEYEKLSNQIKLRIEEINVLFEKRKSEVVEPVRKRIGDKAKEFAKQKNYFLIIDKTAIEEGIITDVTDDVTKEFIKFCNEEFEKEKTQKQ